MKILTLSLLIVLLWAPNLYAQKIVCNINRIDKSLAIENDKVVMFDNQNIERREIASIMQVRTKLLSNGLTKYLSFEGKQYQIHIDDKNQFSDNDDYISIRSNEGHEITYPISCQLE